MLYLKKCRKEKDNLKKQFIEKNNKHQNNYSNLQEKYAELEKKCKKNRVEDTDTSNST